MLQLQFSSYQTACGINVNWPAAKSNWGAAKILQKFFDLLLKSSSLLPHKAKYLAHITYFICNLHNQKLQHYVLGKNTTIVQNAIMFAQKKDAEHCIIEGSHNHNSGHDVNSIYNKQTDNQNNMGSCYACNHPHLVRDCNESICNRCRSNLDNHTPAKCPRKSPLMDSKYQTPLIIITALEINLMVTMTQMCNFLLPPVK